MFGIYSVILSHHNKTQKRVFQTIFIIHYSTIYKRLMVTCRSRLRSLPIMNRTLEGVLLPSDPATPPNPVRPPTNRNAWPCSLASQRLAELAIWIFECNSLSNTVKAIKLVFVEAKCEIIAYICIFQCWFVDPLPSVDTCMIVWTALNPFKHIIQSHSDI